MELSKTYTLILDQEEFVLLRTIINTAKGGALGSQSADRLLVRLQTCISSID